MEMPNKSISRDYGECYVAFLDILGFKRIASVHSHEHLKSVYQKFSETIMHGLSNGKYVLSKVDGIECLGPDIRQATVNSLLVSDSILIWTDDNSAESFGNIVNAVRSLLAFSMIDGIPLRGAISIGPISSVLNQLPTQAHNFQHSLFGRAIVDAAALEKKQEWSGCEISKAAIETYKENCPDWRSLIENKLITLYPVPRKSESVETDDYVIDWVNHPQAGIDANVVKDAFAPPLNSDKSEWEKFKINEWPKVKIILDNTLKFVEQVKSLENQVFVPWHGRH